MRSDELPELDPDPEPVSEEEDEEEAEEEVAGAVLPSLKPN